MNLDEVTVLEQMLKELGYNVKKKAGWSSETIFGKKVKTDDKDIKLVISGNISWRLET